MVQSTMPRVARKPLPRRDVSNLTLLASVHQVVLDRAQPQDRLAGVLAELASHGGVTAGAISVLRPDSQDLVIVAGQHLGASPPARFRAGHETTRQAIETAQAIVLPQVGTNGDVTFVCLPIAWEGDVIGALSLDVRRSFPGSTRDARELYSVVATMIASTVSRRRAELHHRPDASNNDTHIIARAAAMTPVFEMIDAVADSDATVLIRGESGTGKELVADAIHKLSPRRDGPFIKVNCAALATGVLESELFGHEPGAFTGASKLRIGRFEAASGGTIFLDEIGDFAPSVQVILLRILQQQTFERVGGIQTLRTNVRVVAATNRDLEGLMASNQFRQDLYYRLNVFPIHVPPLRERRADILLLANTFIERFATAFGKDVRRITSDAIDLLTAYHWPGNVRELENCIERATLLTRDHVIHAHHLPPTLQTAASSGTKAKGTLQATLDAVERELLVDALKDTRDDIAQAARKLGLTERQMELRVRHYGLQPDVERT